jgi:hypothetical protein
LGAVANGRHLPNLIAQRLAAGSKYAPAARPARGRPPRRGNGRALDVDVLPAAYRLLV